MSGNETITEYRVARAHPDGLIPEEGKTSADGGAWAAFSGPGEVAVMQQNRHSAVGLRRDSAWVRERAYELLVLADLAEGESGP